MRQLLLGLFALLLATSCAGVARAGSKADAEIDALIARVGQARDVVFIRNGSEHTAGEAARHLQRKREAAHVAFSSADQFIDLVGTRSSLTGRAYRVRLPDGRELDSATWLRGLLRDLRQARAVTGPPPAAAGVPSHPPAGR
jgi:hypothetical protein